MKLSPKTRQYLRRRLLFIAVVATLLAIFILVEDWRGDHAWAAAEQELRAKGEPLDLAAFQTPPIPDDRNFFKAPMLDGLLYAKSNDPKNKSLRDSAKLNELSVVWNYLPSSSKGGPPVRGKPKAITTANDNSGDLQRAQQNLLNAITTTPNDPTGVLHRRQQLLLKAELIHEPLSDDPASDILAAMKPAKALLDAVTQAARERPEAWLPILFPPEQPSLDFGLLITLGNFLHSRAMIELLLRRTDDAFADACGLLGLARAMHAGAPAMENVLYGEALCGRAADVLTTGCLHHQWTDSQLVALEGQLSNFQSLAQLKKSLQFERVWLIHFLDSPPDFDPMIPEQPWPRWLIYGWRQQNKVSGSEDVQEKLATFDAATGRIFPVRLQDLRQTDDAVRNSHSNPFDSDPFDRKLPDFWPWLKFTVETFRDTHAPYVYFSRRLINNWPRAIIDLGTEENGIREAIIVCALERYRLAHGDFPDTLATLRPTFITTMPSDVFADQPLGYTRTSDGGVELTSLAADGYSEGTIWVQAGKP